MPQAFTEVFGSAQTVAQVPQCFASVVRSAQLPLQLVKPVPQVVVQTPAEHTLPSGQTAPHAPQLPLSLFVFTSQPLIALPSQLAKPAAQMPMPHVPVVHEAAALA